MSDTEREIAIRTQEKFEFYIISLVFTLLALSIQTSVFGISNAADTFELLGWLALFTSGISGLWRLEYKPLERVKHAQKQDYEDDVTELKRVRVLSDEQKESMINIEKAIESLELIIDKVTNSNLRKYTVHRYSFILGLTFLLLSRGYIPTERLISLLFS